MAPISPLSMKRSTSPVRLGNVDQANKRSKTEEGNGTEDGIMAYLPRTSCNGNDMDLYDKGPLQLLKRSVALALEHVGFDGASLIAIEAICSEADACRCSACFT